MVSTHKWLGNPISSSEVPDASSRMVANSLHDVAHVASRLHGGLEFSFASQI